MDVRFMVYLRGDNDLGYSLEDWFDSFDEAYDLAKYSITDPYIKGWMIDREKWWFEDGKPACDVVCIAQSEEA